MWTNYQRSNRKAARRHQRDGEQVGCDFTLKVWKSASSRTHTGNINHEQVLQQVGQRAARNDGGCHGTGRESRWRDNYPTRRSWYNFYIWRGRCDVWVSKNGGEPEKVFTYEEGSGAAFGELAFLYNAPRAATVKANGVVKLWALDQDTFDLQAATTAFREQNAKWISNIPLLSELTERERLTIADAMQAVDFVAGEKVINQEIKVTTYIVRSGQCKCTVNAGNEEVEVLKVDEGGYFGEIALLTDQPRKANDTLLQM